MAAYTGRRLLQAIPLLVLISLLVFVLLHLIPGGPMAAYGNNPNMTAADFARLEHDLGLDAPVHVQYLRWLGALLRGDWGYSLASKRPVLVEIGDRLPNTIYLLSISLAVTLGIAIPIGILSAVRQYSVLDHAVTTVAFAGQSVPIFWFGLMLIIVFHVVLRNPISGAPLAPGGGMYTLGEPFSLLDRLHHLILPVSMLAVVGTATYTRYMRASMLEVIGQDYIRTAHAKGMPARRVLWHHAFRNAAIPVVTILALEVPVLFNGAVFTETIFSWPGMGRLFIESAFRYDYALLMAIILIGATLTIVSNLLADIAYAYLDPRIHYG
ncbi:MAG: diguanylate cyclase [Armatimonadetes bacterium 13_1_40CM_64_14]|nr:MAG: diguanylate cyclase [Armatimonadetes bacterium 13_1_40CM_64_14]